MDLIKILNSIDFVDGRVDLNSVHPTRLNLLVDEGFIDKIDPGDGEPCFYILSSEGQHLMFLKLVHHLSTKFYGVDYLTNIELNRNN